jgi:hypothetical protein
MTEVLWQRLVYKGMAGFVFRNLSVITIEPKLGTSLQKVSPRLIHHSIPTKLSFIVPSALFLVLDSNLDPQRQICLALRSSQFLPSPSPGRTSFLTTTRQSSEVSCFQSRISRPAYITILDSKLADTHFHASPTATDSTPATLTTLNRRHHRSASIGLSDAQGRYNLSCSHVHEASPGLPVSHRGGHQ